MSQTATAPPPGPLDLAALLDRVTKLAERLEPAQAPKTTVSEVIRLYLGEKEADCKKGDFTKGAYYRLWHCLNLFGEMFGTKLVSECRNPDLKQFASAHPEWISSWTIADATGSVVSAFIWAFQSGITTHVPYRRLKNLQAMRPRAAFTEEEYRRLMKTIHDHQSTRKGFPNGNPSRSSMRIALCFLWESGARTCEMRNARWEHIDFEAGVIRLPEHKTAKKSGSDRIIPLNSFLLRLVRFLYRHRKPGQEYVIAGSWGQQWEVSTFNTRFRMYARLAGLRKELTPYSLRHGFCSQALENGVGERQIADVMGHANTRYVSYYGRSTRSKTDHLRRTAEAAKGRKVTGPAPETKPSVNGCHANGNGKPHPPAPTPPLTMPIVGKRKRKRHLNGEPIMVRVIEALQAGDRWADTCRRIANDFGLSWRTMERYIARARERMASTVTPETKGA